MNSENLSTKQSKLSFIFGCIPARLLIAYLPQILDKNILPYYGLGLIIMALNFYYLYYFNLRQFAFEGGGRTWWANIRVYHANHYLLAGLFALNGDSNASVPLLIDVIFGTLAFIYQRFICY
jgi:hypothetical protein